ncbi:apoptosis-stimulating of p53 protein 1 [Culicoides brevitarsis]|uniref:apoptosis-stimulating of p53 protein 1 n=1 Tax=Culicoides brevitarsis TaxID=469753 RepID=UPI00307C75B5
MKQPNYLEEVVPIRATSEELKAMALRQQQQIDTQQQLLVAKEQRLRFLKLQEAKGMEAAEEAERLRRLREKVDAQESKLKRLRALRGQVDLQKTYNVTLSNDLDSIRALFSEKEKELSLAVAKVDVLTRQLEELRRDRRGPLALIQPGNTMATSKELENLRRELMYRNQLSLQQDAKLHLQREALQQRQAELHSVDQRILELQERLNRRKSSNLMLQRMSNDQNDNTLLFYNNNQGFQIQNRSNNNSKHVFTQKRGNVVAVEPYNHNPSKMSQNQDIMNMVNMKKMNVDVDDNSFVVNKKPFVIPVSHHAMDRKDTNDILKLESKKDISSYNGRVGISNDTSNQVIQQQQQGNRSNNNNEMLVNDDLQNSNPNKIEISTYSSPPKVENTSDQDESKLKSQENHNMENSAPETSLKFKLRNTHVIPSGNLLTPPRKPISSVAPSSFTTSTHIAGNGPKVHVVSPSVTLISQLSHMEKPRPALPPKPIKGNLPSSTDDSKQEPSESVNTSNTLHTDNNPIKAKPLTIKKQPVTEQPKLKSTIVKQSQPAFQQFDVQKPSNDSSFAFDNPSITPATTDEPDKIVTEDFVEKPEGFRRKRTLANDNLKIKLARRVSFDPLALLLDASLEGELELIKKTAVQVPNPSAANDEGITALHNAICAGHFEIVKFLVKFGCDVNAQDSDGWTPLHCAASCNNLPMVKFLVESGACLFASTLSDHETPAEKCEEDEEGFDGCSEYLYSVQEKLGIMNNGEVYAVFSFDAINMDELSFSINDKLTILRKGDEAEREWWWAKDSFGKEGYVPRNLLGLYPRIKVQEIE